MEDAKRHTNAIKQSTEGGDDVVKPGLPVPKHALTPPTSEDMEKRERSSSELSDIKDPEEEILPDHYYGGGKVPVFKPTMDQFRSFKKFIEKVDKYGMRSGIIKVIPPKEWHDSLPALDEAVKSIKVKNPITQEFGGAHGKYTQANIEKQRSYNLPQWKALTEESNHQPPAKRGERRRNQEIVSRGRSTRSQTTPRAPDAPKRKPGRPRKSHVPSELEVSDTSGTTKDNFALGQVPPTPTSANSELSTKVTPENSLGTPPKSGARQPKSVSSRRKYNRREAAEEVDEEAFKNFDYRLSNLDEFTPERCHELEIAYWKSLTFAPPMYGADMPGSLFDDRTTSWNVAKLENLLDVLGTKVPGVNTAYLYLGMWKATFAWHLEDVDLYSINYIHFGAPKQWYSISQEDARRFEAAMKSVWTSDAKNCDQFLRHKTYLISPQLLQSQFNIRVNKLVHYEGEFVITFPYGYHSGYNIGYNCAESVNFATEAWLDYGRIAKKCDCEADSVWVDVAEIERKLRGDDLQEFYEETDVEDDDVPNDLPSPPPSLRGEGVRIRKRKRQTQQRGNPEQKTKKVKIRIRVPSVEPCVLCPNNVTFDKLLPTDNGKKAHRLCALYTPETYLLEEYGQERVYNINGIDKARLDLKCNFCRSKRGACFQCAQRKCTRSYHATCAAAAGVQIDTGLVPIFDEDGTEYTCEGYDFRCRYHRPRRPKTATGDNLEGNGMLLQYAKSIKRNETVQVRYLQGDVFGGVVVENRPSERALLIDVLPDGDRIEIEWKYLCYLNPAESQRPKPSANARPLPQHLNNKRSVNFDNRQSAFPSMEEPFADASAPQKWAEFNTGPSISNPVRLRVDLSKENQLWHYLGHISTEARAKFTENSAINRHNINSNFLDSVKPPLPRLPVQSERRSYPASYPSGANVNALNGAMVAQRQQWKTQQPSSRKSFEPQSSQSYRPAAHQTDGNSTTSIERRSQDPNNWHSSYTTGGLTQDRRAGTHLGNEAIAKSYPGQSTNNLAKRKERLESTATRPMKVESPSYASINNPALPQTQLLYAQGTRYNEDCRDQHPTTVAQSKLPDQVRCVAPVARMMGSQSSQISNSSKPPIGYSRNIQDPYLISQIDYLSYIQQFPYLRNSYLRRPKTYESPYTSGSGISAKYLKGLEQQRVQGSEQKQPAPLSQDSLRVSGLTAENIKTPQSQLSNGSFHVSPSRRAPSSNPGAQPQYSSIPSQTAHYQTNEHFREQMSHDNEGIASNSKLKRLIAQLGGGNIKSADDNINSNDDQGLILRKPIATTAATSFKFTEDAPRANVKSPVRPEASPISDVG